MLVFFKKAHGSLFLQPLNSTKTPLAIAIGLIVSATHVHAENAPVIKDQADVIQLSEVIVSAKKKKAKGQNQKVSVGALGEAKILDQPFSVTSVSKAEIEERKAIDVSSVFRYDASTAASNSGRSTQNGSRVLVRGFVPGPLDSYKIDGLAFPNWFLDLDLGHFENVELLKGVSGFAYGVGVPSGIFNYTTKKPTKEKTGSIDVGYKSDSIFSTHLDLGGHFDDENRFGYRLNAVKEEGKSFNEGDVDKKSASLTLDAQITDNLKAYFNGHILDYDLDGFSGAIIQNANFTDDHTISGSTQTGIPGLYKESKMHLATIGLDWQFSPDWSLNTAYRNAYFNMINANIVQIVTNNQGDYITNQSFSERKFYYDQIQSDLNGLIETGSLLHHLSLGLQYQTIDQDDDKNQDSKTNVNTGNLYHPNNQPRPDYVFNFNPSLYRMAEYKQQAITLRDTIDLNEKWSVLLGGRFTNYKQKNYSPTGDKVMDYNGDHFTPTAGLIFKPQADTTLYASWSEHALQSGGGSISPTIANYGEAFPPMLSKQIEVGAKTEKEKWYANVAIYELEKQSEYVNSSNFLVQDGVMRSRGIELAGGVRPLSNWQIDASLALLDSEYTRAQPEFIGNRVEGAPKVQAAAFTKYDLNSVPGLSLNTGVRYTGKVYSDPANTKPFKAYALTDIGFNYKTAAGQYPITFGGAIRNVFDKEYWVTSNSSWLQPGDPRDVVFNVKVDF